MQDAQAIERIRIKYHALDAVLDGRSRRQWAAAEARDYGYGGVTAVATATGLARDTIAAGLRELEYRASHPDEPVAKRLRHGGAGRKRATESNPADLANGIGLKLTVSHFPPGTSKWNKVEHRLFCFITQNWRGKPLASVQVIVNLIAATRTRKGLIVKAALDEARYETDIMVTDDQLVRVNIKPARFHGEWNYTIKPNSTTM